MPGNCVAATKFKEDVARIDAVLLADAVDVLDEAGEHAGQAADNAGRRDRGQLRNHFALGEVRRVEHLVEIDAGLDAHPFEHSNQHFELRIASASAEAARTAVDDGGTCIHRSNRVRDAHAEVVVRMEADRDVQRGDERTDSLGDVSWQIVAG